jgi:hypothetical protein
MTAWIAIGISILAFGLSALTAWLTLFRRGSVRMTKPTFIAFSYDLRQRGSRQTTAPKLFLRALIYSTGKRGHIVENMYVTVRRGETSQTFNVWGHGDERLSRGSGLYVGETGVVQNHHFNPPDDATGFSFGSGGYQLDVFAALVGAARPVHLSSIVLEVPEPDGAPLQTAEHAYYFDWGPDSGKYHGHLEFLPPPLFVQKLTLPS